MTAAKAPYLAYQSWASAPISGRPFISVVVPAYNEEDRILPTIGAIAVHLSSLGMPWELIVADDGSSDRTVSLLQELGWPNLKVLIASKNGGKGSAVRRGVLTASGEMILIADADQSTPIEQVDMLVQQLHEGNADVVIGSRAICGADVRRRSLLRRALSLGLHLLVKVSLNLEVEDTQCGFKLFRAEAAEQVFGRQVVDDFSFDLEVLYLCRKLGIRILEVPVEWIDAPGSTVAPTKVTGQFLVQLALIRLRDLVGKYERNPSVQTPVPARPRSLEGRLR